MVEALLFRPMADSVGLTLGPHKVRAGRPDPPSNHRKDY